jgi:hypothetical protein
MCFSGFVFQCPQVLLIPLLFAFRILFFSFLLLMLCLTRKLANSRSNTFVHSSCFWACLSFPAFCQSRMIFGCFFFPHGCVNNSDLEGCLLVGSGQQQPRMDHLIMVSHPMEDFLHRYWISCDFLFESHFLSILNISGDKFLIALGRCWFWWTSYPICLQARPPILSSLSLMQYQKLPGRLLFFPWRLFPRHGSIAADTDFYPFGTRMFVPGYGWGEARPPITLNALVSLHLRITCCWQFQLANIFIRRHSWFPESGVFMEAGGG